MARLIEVSVSLSNPLPAADVQDDFDEDEVELTPSHLNPKFLLGSANDPRGEIAQLYAVQIASQLVRSAPQERRTLLIGMGLTGKLATDYESNEARDLITQVLEMLAECRVW